MKLNSTQLDTLRWFAAAEDKSIPKPPKRRRVASALSLAARGLLRPHLSAERYLFTITPQGEAEIQGRQLP